MNVRAGPWYNMDMANRLPQKTLEGRRVRVLHSMSTVDGATGDVKSVNTHTGDVIVTLEQDGRDVTVNWGSGDRWMVIPSTVPAHP